MHPYDQTMDDVPSDAEATSDHIWSMTALPSDEQSPVDPIRSSVPILYSPGTKPSNDFDLPPVLNTVQAEILMEETCSLLPDKEHACFNRFLRAIRLEEKSKKTVTALLAVSKLSLPAEKTLIVTTEIMKLLRCTHECSQTTAAKYLSERKHSDDVWRAIMIETLIATVDIPDGSRSTS
jgi:hypothetical protein